MSATLSQRNRELKIWLKWKCLMSGVFRESVVSCDIFLETALWEDYFCCCKYMGGWFAENTRGIFLEEAWKKNMRYFTRTDAWEHLWYLKRVWIWPNRQWMMLYAIGLHSSLLVGLCWCCSPLMMLYAMRSPFFTGHSLSWLHGEKLIKELLFMF